MARQGGVAMDDGGELLRFRPRGLFEEPVGAGWLGPADDGWCRSGRELGSAYGSGRYDAGGSDEGGPDSVTFYGGGGYGSDGFAGRGGTRLGELTQVVLIGDQLVDVVRRPVAGSDYERAALELRDRGLLREPAPPAPAPVPPPHEQQLAWLERIVGGVEVLQSLGTDPLEMEELGFDGIRGDLRERVAGIDERLTR